MDGVGVDGNGGISGTRLVAWIVGLTSGLLMTGGVLWMQHVDATLITHTEQQQASSLAVVGISKDVATLMRYSDEQRQLMKDLTKAIVDLTMQMDHLRDNAMASREPSNKRQ